MRRRDFIKAVAGSAITWPLAARAQQAGKLYRIGFLSSDSESAMAMRVESFRLGLRDLGYVEGTNVIIEYRFANEKYEQLPELAAELVRSNVDVVVTHGTPGSMAAKKATTSIPVVMAIAGDPVASGIVISLARPGANITGQAFFAPEINAKRIELLKRVMPQMAKAAVLFNPDNPISAPELKQAEQTARSLNIGLSQIPVHGPGEFKDAFAKMEQLQIEAVTMDDDIMLLMNAGAIAALAEKRRIASIGGKDFARSGGLMAYGVDFPAIYRRAAIFVDKILKGAKPADIPIEHEFILNLKTAKALGLTVSNETQLLADEVIE